MVKVEGIQRTEGYYFLCALDYLNINRTGAHTYHREKTFPLKRLRFCESVDYRNYYGKFYRVTYFASPLNA